MRFKPLRRRKPRRPTSRISPASAIYPAMKSRGRQGARTSISANTEARLCGSADEVLAVFGVDSGLARPPNCPTMCRQQRGGHLHEAHATSQDRGGEAHEDRRSTPRPKARTTSRRSTLSTATTRTTRDQVRPAFVALAAARTENGRFSTPPRAQPPLAAPRDEAPRQRSSVNDPHLWGDDAATRRSRRYRPAR